MGESFNAYQKWLGIPTEQQPPNPYRLLGLELFESDPETIHHAADRQMAHVRTFQTGQHQEVCQTLLNEISAARMLLLDAGQRAALDGQLAAAVNPQASSSGPEIVPVAAAHGQSVTARLKKKQKKQGPRNRTMDIIKIVAGSLGGLAIAIVFLLLLGVDPFGFTGDPDPEPKEVVKQPLTPKTKVKQKQKLTPKAQDPFRPVSTPAGAVSQDPFQLTIAEIDAAEIDPPDDGTPAAPKGKSKGGATQVDKVGLKTPRQHDEQKVRQTSQLLPQAAAHVSKLTDTDNPPTAAERSQLADTIRETFCLAAHVVTHAKAGAIKPDVFRSLTNTFGKIGRDPPAASLMGDLASYCLTSGTRSNDGVVLIGRLRNVKPSGPLFEIEIELDGNSQSVYAITADDPTGSLNSGERLVMLGAVVDDPKNNLGGYQGVHKQVVWSGFVIALQ